MDVTAVVKVFARSTSETSGDLKYKKKYLPKNSLKDRTFLILLDFVGSLALEIPAMPGFLRQGYLWSWAARRLPLRAWRPSCRKACQQQRPGGCPSTRWEIRGRRLFEDHDDEITWVCFFFLEFLRYFC